MGVFVCSRCRVGYVMLITGYVLVLGWGTFD